MSDNEAQTSPSETFNAVPPPGWSDAPPPAEADTQASRNVKRLNDLKMMVQNARNKNHKAVVEESRRNQLGPQALKKERLQASNAKKPKTSSRNVLLNTTAQDAQDDLHGQDKKKRRKAEFGWAMYNEEAQYRGYKKNVKRAVNSGRLPSTHGETSASASLDGDPNPLSYGRAPHVQKERVQALVDELQDAEHRRANFSRRRTFDEGDDVTSINMRNENFNKKIERAFNPYTREIKDNLERGTAL